MSGSEEEFEIEFPCEFPIKAMGHNVIGFDVQVVEIVRRHAPDLGEGAVRCRDSAGGKYISVTVTVNATSRAQLDAIYQDLVDCDSVIMAI